MKKPSKCVAGIALALIAATAWGEEHKEYPITLKVIETDAISSKADGTRTTTNCTSAGLDDLTCTSTQVPGALHTDLVSFATASDGRAYLISCEMGLGRRFLSGGGEAMAASAGVATVSGCSFPLGIYKARWDKGRLKVLYQRGGKSKETTFTVLSSAPIPPGTPQMQQGGPALEKTLLLLSSVPTGADIEMDGSFVGQTPSSIPVPPGEHSIRINKKGYKQWERKVSTAGGAVTIAAELEQEQK